jgi:hypothetical protein
MSKGKSAEAAPTVQLPECIRQLQLINNNLYSLKVGTNELIEAVERGDLEIAKHIITRFQLRQILENLTTKD